MKVQTSLSMPWLGATVAFLPALFVAFQDGAPQEAKATKEDPKHPTSSRLEAASLDAMFEAAWAADGVKPNSPADDAEWIRRASLTLNGCIPTAEEVTAFLGDHSRDKRAKKVDELLSRPEYGEHFGGEWELALVGRGARGQRFDRNAFGEWIIGEFNKNTPFNEFTKDVITASGTPEQNAAVGYMERWQGEPKDLAGQTAKAFLGIQIQCARCHDHKDQQWKQSDFNDFAAFYADVKVAPIGKKMDGKPPVMEVSDEPEKRSSGMFGRKNQKNMEARAKNAKNPEKVAKEIEKRALKTMSPSPLRPLSEGPFAVAEPAPSNEPDGAGPAAAPSPVDTAVSMTRRERLAAWMIAPDNPFFARSVVNTTFASLFGYGLVNPISDFRSDSKVAIPPLLDALAKEFVASGYDHKALVGLLAKSRAFGLSSAGNPNEKNESRESHEKIFSRFVSRPMSPEQLVDSVVRSTGIDEAAEARLKAMPEGKRPKNKKGALMPMTGEKAAGAVGALRNQALRRFITVFEDDEQGEDIDFEGTIPQALLMMNSQLMTRAVASGFTVTKAMGQPDASRVEWLYLTILSRKPTFEELTKANGYVQRAGGVEKREPYEDLAWALLNSAEYSTVH